MNDRISFQGEPGANSHIAAREAADTLIFASEVEETRAAMADVESLADHLVASDRWSEERARQLVDDLLACGPVAPVG